MKKHVFFAGMLALGLVFGMISCGANPKGLAKESYDLSMKALGALFDEAKQAKLEKDAEKIATKVEKLSEADKKTYEEELTRLSGEALGGLFNLAGEALNATSKIVESAGNIPSELLGGWYYKSDKEKAGSPALEFTADGKCTSGIQWFAVSVSGNTIAYDYFERGTETGTFDYRITDGELSISGAAGEDGFFAIFQGRPLVKK